jgi:hypothetical protein
MGPDSGKGGGAKIVGTGFAKGLKGEFLNLGLSEV